MNKKPKQSKPENIQIVRLGKDEMNLVEHPFAALWQKEGSEAVISYQWETRNPITGKKVQASWKVIGHPEMGLPNASDERVYLVLMELTREAGFENQTIPFSRYDLLKRLGWKDDPTRYEMLSNAFKRLQSVKIQADNAFWDAGHKSFRNVGFSLIEVYDILAQRPGRKKKDQQELPASYFTWNDVIFASFQSGFLKTLDLDFALALKGDITLRLYRYLDKKSYDGRQSFEIELEPLCVRHLGMKPSPYPSKLKERLKPAHDELIAKGFLQGVSYSDMKSKKAQKICYIFTPRVVRSETELTIRAQDGAVAVEVIKNSGAVDTSVVQPATLEILTSEVLTSHSPSPSDNLGPSKNDELLQQMLDLKVSPEVAQDLMQSTTPEMLRLQLDCLRDRAPKDAAATFVKAVRENWAPPPKYFERVEAAERAARAREHQEAAAAQKTAQQAAEREKQALQDQEAARLDAMWHKLDPKTQERIEAQAKERLGVLGQTGRAQAALVAMRRNLLREMLGKATGDTSQG